MTLYTSWRDKLVADYTEAVQKPVCAECGVHSGAPCINPCGVVHEARKNQALVEGYWNPFSVKLPTMTWLEAFGTKLADGTAWTTGFTDEEVAR